MRDIGGGGRLTNVHPRVQQVSVISRYIIVYIVLPGNCTLHTYTDNYTSLLGNVDKALFVD